MSHVHSMAEFEQCVIKCFKKKKKNQAGVWSLFDFFFFFFFFQFEIVLVEGGGTRLRGLVGCLMVTFERLLGH